MLRIRSRFILDSRVRFYETTLSKASQTKTHRKNIVQQKLGTFYGRGGYIFCFERLRFCSSLGPSEASPPERVDALVLQERQESQLGREPESNHHRGHSRGLLESVQPYRGRY